MASTNRILFDTCAVQYTLDPDCGPKLKAFLGYYSTKGYDFFVSNVSIFECTNAAKPERADVLIAVIDNLYRYGIDEKVLEFAAYLFSFYSQDQETRKSLDRYSVPDLLIGATAILTNSLILTTDFHDFPRPFFLEQEHIILKYVRSKKASATVAFLLVPNRAVIDTYMAQRLQVAHLPSVLNRQWRSSTTQK